MSLHKACEENDIDEVRRICSQKNVDLNKYYDWRTPLFIACLKVHYEVLKELLKHPKIDVNEGSNYDEDEGGYRTPLYVACQEGSYEVVKELLKHPKIDVNKGKRGYDYRERTPLYVACQEGHYEVVKELLKHPKIDANEGSGENFDSPLYVACEEKHERVVLALLEHDEIDRSTAKKFDGFMNECEQKTFGEKKERSKY